MTFLLVLQGVLGFVMLGEYSTEQECQEGAVQYMALLAEQKSSDKHNPKMICIGIPEQMPQPRSMDET